MGGLWIREERDRRGLSQANLARLLQMSQPKLSQWETGKTSPGDTEEQHITDTLLRFDESLKTGKVLEGIRPRSKKRIISAANGEKKEEPVQISTDSAKDRATRLKTFERSNCSDRDQPTALALFSGCGGMSLGFKNAGFFVPGYLEIVEPARITYEKNFPGTVCLGHDVRSIDNKEIKNWHRAFGHVDVLFGGPPCQGFSLTGKRDRSDPRNELYLHFARIANELRPSLCVLENVRLLTSMKAPDGSLVIDSVEKAFEDIGYTCTHQVLNAQDYGVPQSRERVFVVARRDDIDFTFPAPTHGPQQHPSLFEPGLKPYRTFRDVCGELPRLESGEKCSVDKLHFSVKHPEHVIKWLRDVPEGQSAHDNDDPTLRPPSGYNTTYKRLRWDVPSSTINTTFGMISGCRNVHPENTRSLTIREAVRCQTFPDDFEFCGNLGDIRTMIGNAVPPQLAKALAEQALCSINSVKLATC